MKKEISDSSSQKRADLKSCSSEKSPSVPSSMPNQSVVIEPVNQMIAEDELTGLLLAANGWDDCQLELLDSLLDSL